MLGRQTLVLVAIAVIAGSCGFNSRSDEFECTTNADCTGGRVCHDSWCVVPDSVGDANVSIDAMLQADAPVNGPDAMMSIDAPPGCPAPCSTCTVDTCIINCDTTNACPDALTCPAGMRCEVNCTAGGTCAGAIDCSMATACDITCDSTLSCTGGITCGTGTCNISCTGDNSCDNGIDCDASCGCTTDCSGAGACGTAPNCPGNGNTCRSGGNCVLLPVDPCNTCP